MILTIKGADFSGANIGTNTTVKVTYNGSVTNQTQYIERGTDFNVTITLKTDYTYNSLSITVGGSTITGYTATPDSENRTVSLSIPGNLITGAVSITVNATYNGSGEAEPEEPGTGGGSVESGTQLISAFRNNSANAQYIHDGTYKVVDGEVSFAGNGKTYKYFILPLNVFNITDLKCVTGLKDANDIAPIVFLKNNEMKSENIVGDLTFGGTQKVDGVTMHTSFAYYANGFPSIPEGANYVAFSDFIDRETLKVADEKLTITFE